MTQPAPDCRCDFRTKLVGDGCPVCQPDTWKRYLGDLCPKCDSKRYDPATGKCPECGYDDDATPA